MRIEHLEECIDLAETLNFTKTAKNFYITQPVLSKHISNLEVEFSIQLFLRDQNRVRLTTVGERFIQDAKITVQTYHNLIENIKLYKEGINESLSVGFLFGAASPFIPSTHLAFAERYPSVDLQYSTHEFNEIFEALFNNEVDIIIAIIKEELPDDKYQVYHLFEDEYCAVLPNTHPLATRISLSPTDLAGETVVLPSDSLWHSLADNMREYLNPAKNEISIKTPIRDMNTLPILLKTEKCVGITLGHLRQYYDNISFVPLSGYSDKPQISAVWKKSNTKENLSAYVELLNEVIKNTQQPDRQLN